MVRPDIAFILLGILALVIIAAIVTYRDIKEEKHFGISIVANAAPAYFALQRISGRMDELARASTRTHREIVHMHFELMRDVLKPEETLNPDGTATYTYSFPGETAPS